MKRKKGKIINVEKFEKKIGVQPWVETADVPSDTCQRDLRVRSLALRDGHGSLSRHHAVPASSPAPPTPRLVSPLRADCHDILYV